MYVEAEGNDNKMATFWVDTTNDEMLGYKAMDQITKIIKFDANCFAGKHLVNVKLILRPRLDFCSLKPDNTDHTLFAIWIEVNAVAEKGAINTSLDDMWMAA